MTTWETPIALLVSVIIAFVGFPFSSYQCWWSWAPFTTIVGTVLYLLVVGVGGGMVGIAIKSLSSAHLTGNVFVDAVLLGVGGALLLRSDLRPRSRSDAGESPGPGAARQAASIVGALVTYTSASLDVRTKRRAEQWFTQLADIQLARQSLRLVKDLATREDCTKAFKDKTSHRVVDEIENLAARDRRDAAKAHLVGFCTDYATTRHMAKIATIT